MKLVNTLNLGLVVSAKFFWNTAKQQNVAHQPTVDLDYAQIYGNSQSDYKSYLGIPFAEPPIGQLRFQPPKPISGRKIIVNATGFGYSCWQKPVGLHNIGAPVRDEDCLTINVWTPLNCTKESKLPVAVIVYGGGFDSGYAAHPYYDGERIRRGNNIIIVTFNYRVGAFGFLASQELKERGYLNAGILDQKSAFEWVQKYITEFGGDPDKVTAVGQSAGAITLSILMTGSKSNLFSKAVIMSGGPPLLLKYPTHVQQDFNKIQTNLNCSNIKCLQSQSAEQLWNASKGIQFSPVVDGTLIPDQPLVSFLKSNYAKMPMMLSTVRDEGNLFTQPLVKNQDQVLLVEKMLLPFLSNDSMNAVQRIYNASTYELPFQAVGDVYGDFLFQCPSYLLEKLGRDQGYPIYRAKFNANSNEPVGVTHGSDLPYFLSYESTKNSSIADFLSTQWLNFAQSKALARIWQPTSQGLLLVTDEDLEMVKETRSDKCEFWFNAMISLFSNQS